MFGSHTHCTGVDNIRYLKINENLRLKMARMLELGVPMTDIVDRLHKEISTGGGTHFYGPRVDHISMQDNKV